MNVLDKIERYSPFIIDGGLSNVLESQGHGLNHRLWTALLISENPEAIINAHLEYIEAGAQCITTASYQASIKGFIESGFSQEEGAQLILKSVTLAEIAIQRAHQLNLISSPPLIAASVGPYGAYLADGSEYTGKYQVSSKELEQFHSPRLSILDISSADLLAVETIPSINEAEVLSILLDGLSKPSWVSFACKNEEELNDGSKIVEAVRLFTDNDQVLAVGVNCTEPRYISGLIRNIRKVLGKKKVVVYPNSGEAYNAKSKSWLGASHPEFFLKMAAEWIEVGGDILGGCCRIKPDHIKQLRQHFTK